MSYIEFSKDEKNQFYEQLGSAHFKLQGEANKEYTKHLIDIYFKSVGFTATVVGTIGIIAGFGFTALSFVQSPFLFFVGEGVLVYSILHGLIWIQNVYKGEFDSLQKARNKHSDYFSERNEKFKKVWNEISTSNKVKEGDFKDFFDFNSKAVDLFVSENPDENNKEKPIFSKKLYYSMIVGAICLISSFFIYSLLNKILCILFKQ